MSSIPAVKAKLVEVLTTAMPDVQVIYGPASSVTTTKSRMLTVGRAAGVRDLDSISLQTASEQYTVDLTAYADIPGADQQDADDLAAGDYAGAVAAVLAQGPALGLGEGISVLPTGEFELDEASDSNGRHAVVRFSVSVYAQTT